MVTILVRTCKKVKWRGREKYEMRNEWVRAGKFLGKLYTYLYNDNTHYADDRMTRRREDEDGDGIILNFDSFVKRRNYCF